MTVEWAKGRTYFRRWGFSVNEGGAPLNFHLSWNIGCNHRWFWYVYLFGHRWHRGSRACDRCNPHG